jgi:uncharacterized ion transporter superfamily protein YfcC
MIETLLALLLIIVLVAHITWVITDGHAAVTRFELEEQIRRLKGEQ